MTALPDTLPRVINQSQLKSWRRCQKEWEYRYKLSLVPKEKARPLFLGSWVHACLETHYRDGDWKIGFNQYLTQYNALFQEERDALDRGRGKTVRERLPSIVKRIMRSYLWYYRNDGMKAKKIEETFAVKLNNITVKGRIDVVWEDEDGNLWMVDHKTASSIPPATAFHAMDPQLQLYPWAAKKAWGLELAGVIWNYVKSKPPTIPTLNRDGSISRRKIVTDYPTAVKFLRDAGLDPKDFTDYLRPLASRSDFLRRYKLPREEHVIKRILQETLITGREINLDRVIYPRTITKDCVRCAYMPLCKADLEGGDTAFLIKRGYQIEEEEELGTSDKGELIDDDHESSEG
jgi:PD-(D/E)XK nuclease superfamily